MPATLRPRRSVLYVPGDNARAIVKARSLAADALIFDLEDAVAPDAKGAARKHVVAALAQGGYGRRERAIRVNALATPWGRADLAAVARAGADAVLLPKTEGAAMVREAEEVLAAAGAPDSLALWCMIETPRGVLQAEAIAEASDRLAALVMGTTDLAHELGVAETRDREPLLVALGHCVLVARAFGLGCLDGVHLDLSDAPGFARLCRQGAAMGFDGKTLIHPKTIAVANRAFTPSKAELARARKIIAAHAKAKSAGKGVTLVDGRLVEQPHVNAAQRILALAEQIAMMVGEAGIAS